MDIRLKRIYDNPAKSDGTRILIDRLWPRGLTKSKAKVDVWLKDIAPSAELRKWFNHEPAKWAEFKKLYCSELNSNPQAVTLLKEHLSQGKATILYGAHNQDMNHAVVIKQYLDGQLNCRNN